MANPIRIGIGAGCMLVGVYVALSEFSVAITISGLVLMAIGIGIIFSAQNG